MLPCMTFSRGWYLTRQGLTNLSWAVQVCGQADRARKLGACEGPDPAIKSSCVIHVLQVLAGQRTQPSDQLQRRASCVHARVRVRACVETLHSVCMHHECSHAMLHACAHVSASSCMASEEVAWGGRREHACSCSCACMPACVHACTSCTQ